MTTPKTPDQVIYVLTSYYSDGSGVDIVRAYTDKDRAQMDYELASTDSTKSWRLDCVKVFS